MNYNDKIDVILACKDLDYFFILNDNGSIELFYDVKMEIR